VSWDALLPLLFYLLQVSGWLRRYSAGCGRQAAREAKGKE
jgi:hypothetical protein